MEQAGPPTDLVAAFALPVPSLVICELLGVPYADREQFQRLSSRSLDFSIPEEQQKQAYMDMLGYMATLVARQRRAPDEAMLGMLVREHGDDLTDAELTGIGNLLLFAGHETTANMVGLGTLLLLEHPEQLALLRDDPAPETVVRAVEELLRYLTVVNHGVTRTATEDVVLGRQRIKAGEHVMVSLPTANRDETVFQEPDRLNLTRKPEPHVAFGHGIHHCLGAPLARMEMRIAFPALLRRFPRLRLAVPVEKLRFREVSLVYGVNELPVAW
jgi:cytochrome P450